MDLRQLGYVVAVADQGGFTRAARALHVAQPSLSQAVRALEHELGVELFVRAGRRVVLTAAGEALVGPARQVLRDMETARAAVGEVAGVRAGRLDVACLPTLAVHPVAGLVGAFRRRHPQVRVRVVEPDTADAAVRLVRDGTCEIGLVELPVAGADLVALPLEDQDIVAVLGAGGLPGLRRGRRLPLAALGGAPLITTPRGTSTRRLVDEALVAVGVEPEVVVEIESREAIGALVAAGAGMSLVPRAVAEQAALHGAEVREVTPPIRRSVGAVRRDGPLSPAGRAFLAVAVDTLAGEGSGPSPS